jgi:hypothetical protein
MRTQLHFPLTFCFLHIHRFSSSQVILLTTCLLAEIISSTLKIEAICSSETSVATQHTRRHIPEDDTLHNHRCENLKSYNVITADQIFMKRDYGGRSTIPHQPKTDTYAKSYIIHACILSTHNFKENLQR